MTEKTIHRQKATFTLSQKTKEDLFQNIISTKRSRFVDKAIQKALQEEARMKSIEILHTIKPTEPVWQSSEDILYELRTS